MNMRKIIIKFKIRFRKVKKYIKHLYYSAIFVIKIANLIKVLVGLFIFIILIALLGLGIIKFWNFLIAPNVGIYLPEFSITVLFTGRYNILWIVGMAAGSLVSVFRRSKLEWFAEQVNAKPSMIYIFGANQLVERVVRELIGLGFGPFVALIAEKKYYWIEELGATINVLILDSVEELKLPTLYRKITFRNALKILCLVDNPELSQHIILNVRRVNPEAEIILLSRNKPYILDLIGEQLEKIIIVEDLDTLSREIIRMLALGFIYAPVIEAKAPPEYAGKPVNAVEEDFDYKIKVLGVKRGDKIIQTNVIEQGDVLILYLVDRRVLKEFVELIPFEGRIEEEEAQSSISLTESESSETTAA